MQTIEQPKQNNLGALRKRCGLTQKEVASRLGLKCEDRISHWEKGKAFPSIMNLWKLSKLYSVEPGEIFEY